MLKKTLILGASVTFALFVGCTSQRVAVTPPPHPLDRDIQTVHKSLGGIQQHSAPEVMELQTSISLRQALVLALMKNPELEAFSHEVRAAEARTLQADLLRNPELELELESFDRDGEGYDSSEPSIMLGQVIELGRKRHWRVRIAEAKGELAEWNYASKRLEVFTETAHRFTNLIAAQQRLELARSSLELAEQTHRTVDERVKAGKEPPVQKLKTSAEMELARLDTAEAENILILARHSLAAIWGSDRAVFLRADGHFNSIIETLPAMDILRAQLASNPELAASDVAIKMQQAALDSERAARIPDLTVAAGVKRFEEDGTHALIFGIGVPLPLFDQNQGNIIAAKHELATAQAEARATSIELSTRLIETHARLSSAHKRAQVLRSKVVPAMEETFKAAHKGYKEGKFGFLDVLDAQRSLFAMRNEMIDALVAYQTALIDIERLTGMSIDKLLAYKEEK